MKVFFFNDIYAKTTSLMSLALITSDLQLIGYCFGWVNGEVHDRASHEQTRVQLTYNRYWPFRDGV